MVTNLSDDTKINRKDKRGIKYRFKKLCEYSKSVVSIHGDVSELGKCALLIMLLSSINLIYYGVML